MPGSSIDEKSRNSPRGFPLDRRRGPNSQFERIENQFENRGNGLVGSLPLRAASPDY